MLTVLKRMKGAAFPNRLHFLLVTRHANLHTVNRAARQLVPTLGCK